MQRKIKKIYHSRPTIDGAGVSLNRVFSNAQVPEFDPFLLLDAFGSDDKSKYIKASHGIRIAALKLLLIYYKVGLNMATAWVMKELFIPAMYNG